jgi:uncharacterized membrane protein YfcA
MKLSFILIALFVLTSVYAVQTKAADFDTQIERGIGKLTDGIGDIASGLTNSKVRAKKDLITLAIGGVAGIIVGSFAAGLLDVKLLGISMMPVIGTLGGIYVANEGYFDNILQGFSKR